MCKILRESEKKELKTLTESLEKLTGKTIKLESKKDCNCCSTENLTEGTWSIPKDKSDVQKVVNAIHTINRMKADLTNVVGDDDLMDHLDGAIQRMQQLIPEELK